MMVAPSRSRFLIDQWGTGRAFVCTAADCGTEVKLYLRAKIGSCKIAQPVSPMTPASIA
jgi:hypothetical protein